MAKFKEGDRVEILSDGHECYGVPKGTRGIVQEDDTAPFVLWDVGNGDRIWATDEDKLKLVERTMENLQAGDILVNDNRAYGNEVQGVIGKGVVTTRTNESEITEIYSVTELKAEGWKLKDSNPEIIELTLDEIANKFGIPVGQLSIVKKELAHY